METQSALTCPACHATVTPEDVFCQSCGHRLK
jgi:rRNA maturation endonuclease Nob1